jgi:antitoxin CptB
MTGRTSAASSSQEEDLDARCKKLKFRSWHRGMREMDLILGRFAEAEIGTLTAAEIDQYERLLDIPDTEFFLLVTGQMPVPQHLDCSVLQRRLTFGRSMRF